VPESHSIVATVVNEAAMPAARLIAAVVAAAEHAGVPPAGATGSHAPALNAAARVGETVVRGALSIAGQVANVTEAVAATLAAPDRVDAGAAGMIGSGLLHLPSGPAMLLGLAESTTGAQALATWWMSQQTWRVTQAVSLVVALAGYGYCRADAQRRRQAALAAAPFYRGVASGDRPADGL
jgi:hypothetical protein